MDFLPDIEAAVKSKGKGKTMARRTRRWLISSTVGFGASLALAGRAGSNSGVQLPQWGETGGTTDLQAGPLGLNPASDPGQIPTAVRIPDANVDAEIELQQIVDGQMLNPSGPWVVAWYEQTARAGEVGNCVGSGHVDYYTVGEAVFWEIADLQEGAEIEMFGSGGATYVYAVEYVRRLDILSITPEELNSPEIVGRTDYPALTLVTCGGEFNGDVYLSRDIIRGRLVSVRGADGSSSDTASDTSLDDVGAFAVETEATVNTDGVNLRSEATTSSDVVTQLNNGTAVTIIGGPDEADGFTWWQIELEDGTTGWIAQDFLTP